MRATRWRYGALWLYIGLVFGQSWTATACAAPPNLLVILTDDQGRGDYGAFGTKTSARPPSIGCFVKG